jgi:hypothetical protein
MGHYARQCPKKKQQQGGSTTTTEEIEFEEKFARECAFNPLRSPGKPPLWWISITKMREDPT